MEKKFRNQLLTESEVSENGPFVLIRNKKNKWVITMCGALVNGKEFDTKEEAEKHIARKEWDDILTAALVFLMHVKNQMENIQKK